MSTSFEDNSGLKITIFNDDDSHSIDIKGFEGDICNELIPRLLSSEDPRAAEIVSKLLIWMDANNVKNGQSIKHSRSSNVGGNSCTGGSDRSKAGDFNHTVNSYLAAFATSLIDFKRAQGVRMLQAMAGNVPILIYKAIPDTYCFSFPPETVVYTIDDVKEMARTGHYMFGKRYMDILLEILDVAR